MSKYNKTTTRPAAFSAVKTNETPSGTTYEGAPGYARDQKSELFLLAVAHMGDGSFYESAGDRDTRLRSLVRAVAPSDPQWVTSFVSWLRNQGSMRTASVVVAAEAANALLSNDQPGGRQIIGNALQRADEPGELLAYWTQRFGRNIPMPVKKGVADAVTRLYNPYTLLKYDTDAHGYRFADVVELTHPKSTDADQNRLFKYAIDRRHDRDPGEITGIRMVDARMYLRTQALGDNPQALLDSQALKDAGFTWEDALSLVGSKVDKKELWTALIPSMGYMALLRNLRNFDQAGISDATASDVIGRLIDPEQVAKSRQFPFRFLSAYNAVPSLRWAYALEKALNLSLANVPSLKGRTLILVDRSGSMFGISGRDSLSDADKGAIFGSALAVRAENADLVEFGTGSQAVRFSGAESVLKVVEKFTSMGGTNTAEAVRRHYSGHTRVVIVTDEQAWGGYYGSDPLGQVPAGVPVYTWNLAGYRMGHGPSGSANRHTFGGMTDNAFRMIPLLEAGKSADWDILFG